MAQRYRAAILSAESVPFAKVGGLADVVGALSRAVADLGCSVAVFLPRYADLQLPPDCDLELVANIHVPVGGEDQPALIFRLRHPAHPPHYHHFFVGSETYFGRPGIYSDPATGEPFRDNAERFVFFSRACLEGMRATAFVPDVIHANDHQTALVPAYLRTLYAEDAFFQLPEVAFGLVPGGGGTVSLPRRIGRQRTAWLALSGRRIDATTALAWGLVDRVSGRPHLR